MCEEEIGVLKSNISNGIEYLGFSCGINVVFSVRTNVTHSHICSKGVGLGLFPSDLLESQSYEFIEIAHIGPYYIVECL